MSQAAGCFFPNKMQPVANSVVIIEATVSGFTIQNGQSCLSFSRAQAYALDIAVDLQGDVDIVVVNADRQTHRFDPTAEAYVDMTMTDADRGPE